MTQSGSLRMAVAMLLLLATVVFVVGSRAERSLTAESAASRAEESAAVASVEESAGSHEEGEAGEESLPGVAAASAEEIGNEGGEAHTDEAAAPHDEANEARETILGIDPESTGAVAAAVVISVLLAAALWFWGTSGVLIVVAIFALLFTALDLREVVHQLRESRSALAAIALLAALLHGGVAVIAGFSLTQRAPSAA